MTDPLLDALLSELAERETRADEGGGRARQLRHQRLGRLGARERIAALVDAESFVELGRHVVHRAPEEIETLAAHRHPGDGLVCGLATVDGISIAVYAHDPTVLRGALGRAASTKLCRLLDLAGERRLPVIALVDCDGVRVEEGTDAIDAYGEVIRRTVRLKGRVPQLTLACGLCVGAAAYNAALTDVVGMVAGQSWMFITGPRVTKVVTGEDVPLDELGGPQMHAKRTGAVHAVLESEAAGIAWLKRLIGLLARPVIVPSDPATRETPELGTTVPVEPRKTYDMRKVLAALLDRDTVVELAPEFGGSLLTAVARLGGRSVAVVASQPMVLAGCLDVDASRKAATFVTWANLRRLPIVTLVDVPGYMPGRKQEQGGIVPIGATLLAAYGAATVPRACVVLRKSFGGASVLSFSADVRLGLPTARVAPMGADATLEVVLGTAAAEATTAEREARAGKRADWLARHDHAWAAAASGYLDQVVAPAALRSALSAAVERLAQGEAGHG